MQLKKWKPENWPCRHCKVYVQNASFVEESFYRMKRAKLHIFSCKAKVHVFTRF